LENRRSDSYAEFTWFLQSGGSPEPQVQQELIGSINHSVSLAALTSVFILALGLVAALTLSEWWGFAWVLSELCFMSLRVSLQYRFKRYGDPGVLLRICRVSSLWSMTTGLALLMCIMSGDVMLMILASNLIFAMIGGMSSVLMGVLRLYQLLILAVAGPTIIFGLTQESEEWMPVLSVAIALYLMAMILIARKQHRLLRGKIEAEYHNRQLLNIDPLTNLANRRRLRAVLAGLQTVTGRRATVFYLDLDGFKSVNDTQGHDAGDTVLKEVARRLLRLNRDCDLVCRLGGDEFLVLVEGLSPNQAEAKAQTMVAALREPYETGEGEQAVIGVSIGVASVPDNSRTAEPLITLADEALYAAKNSGKNTYRFSQACPD